MQQVQWGEFTLKDLFEIKENPHLNKDSFSFTNNGKYPYFTRTVFNNGIAGYVDYLDEKHKINGKCLSVGMIGMQFFYMEKDFYAGQFTKRAIPKGFSLNWRLANFFISLLNKNQRNFQNILVRDFKRAFNETRIQLPTKDGKIDFEFMEKFITEIETVCRAEAEMKRRAKIEAYLLVSGLKDCTFSGLNDFTLTDEEKKVLEDFEEGNIEFKKFKVGELFDVMSYKKKFDANKVTISENGHPYIVRTNFNNGVRGYINEDEQFLNDGNTISFGQDTATVFYQEKPYFTGNRVKIFKSKNNRLNKKNAHFFVATITKAFSSFGWGKSSFNVNILKNQQIELPVKDNQPDYEIMETLISVIQKTVVKDLILEISKEEMNENIQD